MNKSIFENIYNNAVEKRLYEEKLTPEDKMDMWHNGTRGFNIAAASTSKLRKNLKICKAKGYKAEASKIRNEIKKRGLKVDLTEAEALSEMRMVDGNWVSEPGDANYLGSYELDDNETGARGGLAFILDQDKKIIYKIAVSVWADKEDEKRRADITAYDAIPEGHGKCKLIAYKHVPFFDLTKKIFDNTKKSYTRYDLWNWANSDGNAIFLCAYKPNGEKIANDKFEKGLFDNQAETFDNIDDVFEDGKTGDVFYTTEEKKAAKTELYGKDETYDIGYSDGYQDGLEDDRVRPENMRRNCKDCDLDYDTYKKGYDVGFKNGLEYRDANN